MLSAVILAAGASTRMGQPKALVPFAGRPFLQTVLDNFRKVGIYEVVTVLGHAAEEIASELALPAGSFVVNQNAHLGQFSSFQTGIRSLPAGVEGAFLALVDQPQITAGVIGKLKDVFVRQPDQLVIPTCRGRRGHPPVFPQHLFGDLLRQPATTTASDLIRQNQKWVLEVEVADERILWNINTPADLQRAERRFGP